MVPIGAVNGRRSLTGWHDAQMWPFPQLVIQSTTAEEDAAGPRARRDITPSRTVVICNTRLPVATKRVPSTRNTRVSGERGVDDGDRIDTMLYDTSGVILQSIADSGEPSAMSTATTTKPRSGWSHMKA